MKKRFVSRWDSDVFKNNKIAKQIANDLKKNLKITLHPFNGWRSEPNQNLKTIQINEYGLRSKKISNLKFKDNAFLIGNSTAWGFGASSNKYIPSYLIENILRKKYRIKINIINLSEQMYSSFEELMSFINNVESLKPKLIILLSGWIDIQREVSKIYKMHKLYQNLMNFSFWGRKIGIFDEKNFFKRNLKYLKNIFRWKDETLKNSYILNHPKKNEIAYKLTLEKFNFINSYCEKKKYKLCAFFTTVSSFQKK